MRVILVDDEKKFITMLAKRLKFRGFEADIATSGVDAIKMATQKKYDIAVLDIKMPGISGTELKEKLALIQNELKFIFVTGHGGVMQSDCVLGPKDIYLSKPLDIDILIDSMTSCSEKF
jgi:DNA-binding response OmpR family regulator